MRHNVPVIAAEVSHSPTRSTWCLKACDSYEAARAALRWAMCALDVNRFGDGWQEAGEGYRRRLVTQEYTADLTVQPVAFEWLATLTTTPTSAMRVKRRKTLRPARVGELSRSQIQQSCERMPGAKAGAAPARAT